MSLRTALSQKRLIFTVTPGRSGTGYLAHLLRGLPDVASYHEAEPSFSDVMRLAQSDPSVAHSFWIEKKLPWIAAESDTVYVETSHLCCKGFIEPLLDIGIVPDIIILSRPHREVAMSLYKLRTIPARTEKGIRYLLHPEDPNVLALPEWRSLHDYQLCYWYCLEIERRSRHYERILKQQGGCVAKTSLLELTTARGLKKLLAQLRLPQLGILNWIRFLIVRQRGINTKSNKKRTFVSLENIDELEHDLSSRIPQ